MGNAYAYMSKGRGRLIEACFVQLPNKSTQLYDVLYIVIFIPLFLACFCCIL